MLKIFLILFPILLPNMILAQQKILISNGEKSVTATLADNEAARTLYDLLLKEEIHISMSDYGSFEKVGALPQQFPTSDSNIEAGSGDIMLYLGRNMVIFYGSNSWSYTPLGKIDDATVDSVKDFLGEGSVNLTLSIPVSGIQNIQIDEDKNVFDIAGRKINSRPLPDGIYISGGKKIVVKK